jgi:hypothetical protein
MNFSSFYLYNRWYTFPSSSSLKLKCHVNLNWGKKIQTETIQFSDIIFTQSDIDAEHNNGCHSQKHFTSALFAHKNILLLCYKFTKYFTSTLCVHKNILLLRYVFTKIFYFYAMCSQKYFTSTLFTKIVYFFVMCSQK